MDAASKAEASRLQDIEAHRVTEIDAMTGAIADLAATRAATALVSQAMNALLHGLELAWRTAHSAV